MVAQKRDVRSEWKKPAELPCATCAREFFFPACDKFATEPRYADDISLVYLSHQKTGRTVK